MALNQIAQRVPERESGSPAHTVEQAPLQPAQANQIVTAIRAWPENGIASAQLVQRLAQDSRA